MNSTQRTALETRIDGQAQKLRAAKDAAIAALKALEAATDDWDTLVIAVERDTNQDELHAADQQGEDGLDAVEALQDEVQEMMDYCQDVNPGTLDDRDIRAMWRTIEGKNP